MNLSAKNRRSASTDPYPIGQRYHGTALLVTFVVVCYLGGQLFWLRSSADQLAIVILTAYYTLIRFIHFITLRKNYYFPLLLNGPLVVFDQIYLGIMAISGLPAYVVLPFNGLLLFMAGSIGVKYVLLAIPAAFISILFSITHFSTFHLNTMTAVAIALATVLAISLISIIPFLMATFSKHSPQETDNPTDSKPLDPEHTSQQSRFLPPGAEEARLRILIISNNDKRLTLLSDPLNDWGYDYTISKNCVQAFRNMLSRNQADKFASYTTLIVDQYGLDLDPRSLAQLIQDEPKLEGLRLICFTSPSANHHEAQQLLKAGYAALLDNPLHKAQLFSALHEGQQTFTDSINVVSLSNHRANRKSRINRGNILLADIASSELTTLSKLLLQAGYKVRIAEDGDQALDILEEQPIDLAVVNIKLPIMSGTQVLKLHRFTTPYKQWVPFVFLSDENNAEISLLCRSIGVQAYLFKPVIAKDLLELISTLLTQRQSTGYAHNHPNPSIESNITRFQHTNLLDHLTLLRLERLDNGIAFINDLYKIFETEGSVILSNMQQAVVQNELGQFLNQAQILLDSAGQLGAFSLYELSRQATKLQAHEFKYRGHEVLEEIEKTFNLTLQAYAHYISQRTAIVHKDHK